MSYVDFASLDHMSAILSEHDHLAYGVLFLGAFFETLIPTSLVVFGELFFIPGALLAGLGILNVWAVTATLYAGGILGDNASYWLGRYWGVSLFERLAKLPLVGNFVREDNYRRGVAFFERRGAIAVFAARLSGPLSWVTPAMAGMLRLNYVTFVRFNALGVMVGIGQFIAAGYFCGEYLPAILRFRESYGLTIFAALAAPVALFIWYMWAKRREQAAT